MTDASARIGRPVRTVLPSQISAANAIHDHHMPGWAGTNTLFGEYRMGSHYWDTGD